MKMSSWIAAGAAALATSAALAAPVTIDFDTDGLGNPLAAGTIITNQYANLGVLVSANNNNASHPDLAIIFNSASPTGGDTDLRTPGPGIGNNAPLGKILIIAENAVDTSPADGRIDVPDDEEAGGWIRFDHSFLATEVSLTLVDIEEHGGIIRFFLNNVPVATQPIPALGDNSVQTINKLLPQTPFNAIRVDLAGSGAIGAITIVPEPASLGLLLLGAALFRRR